MKNKLTLTIDSELVPKAKQFAGGRGLSLSKLVENLLREATMESAPSFAERWDGAFKPANHDNKRYRRLARKYL